jgi:hypothetical protein
MGDSGFELAPAAGEIRFHGPVNLRGFANIGTRYPQKQNGEAGYPLRRRG